MFVFHRIQKCHRYPAQPPLPARCDDLGVGLSSSRTSGLRMYQVPIHLKALKESSRSDHIMSPGSSQEPPRRQDEASQAEATSRADLHRVTHSLIPHGRGPCDFEFDFLCICLGSPSAPQMISRPEGYPPKASTVNGKLDSNMH